MAYRRENGKSQLIQIITADYIINGRNNGGYVIINSSSPINVTAPAGTLPVGFNCRFANIGTGVTTFLTSGGSQIFIAAGSPELAIQYATAILISFAPDEFIFSPNTG